MRTLDVIVIDSSDTRVNRIREKFIKHEIEHVRSVEEAIKVLRDIEDKDTEKVLIWHLSRSKFKGDQVSYLKIPSIVEDEFQKRTSFKYRFAVSNNYKFWPYADKTNWFTVKARDWDNFDLLFKKDDGSFCLTYGLQKLPPTIKKEQLREISFYVFQAFLPLDIDMQALKITGNAEAYLNDMYAGLEELYKLDKYNERNKNEHYRQKFYDLWFLLEPSEENKERASPEAREFTPINNPNNELLEVAGLGNKNPEELSIYMFLESLDERKKDDKDLTKKVKYLLAPFESSGLKGCDGKEINSFHDWYCALCWRLLAQGKGTG